jgi:uncharacterized protein YPO0396
VIFRTFWPLFENIFGHTAPKSAACIILALRNYVANQVAEFQNVVEITENAKFQNVVEITENVESHGQPPRLGHVRVGQLKGIYVCLF